MSSSSLPQGFEALEPFVASWALDNFQRRFVARYESDMPDIRAFYDAITPLADLALDRLAGCPLDELDESETRLLRLLLALAHIAVPVERYGQPRPKGVNWPTTLVVTQGSIPA